MPVESLGVMQNNRCLQGIFLPLQKCASSDTRKVPVDINRIDRQRVKILPEMAFLSKGMTLPLLLTGLTLCWWECYRPGERNLLWDYSWNKAVRVQSNFCIPSLCWPLQAHLSGHIYDWALWVFRMISGALSDQYAVVVPLWRACSDMILPCHPFSSRFVALLNI